MLARGIRDRAGLNKQYAKDDGESGRESERSDYLMEPYVKLKSTGTKRMASAQKGVQN
jgi:hypothetical protein